jgi:pilus assembly protein Flp/PilA
VSDTEVFGQAKLYPLAGSFKKRGLLKNLLSLLWRDEGGQDVAEYAVMLAVILVIVVGTIQLIGTNSNTVFSSVASSISQ